MNILLSVFTTLVVLVAGFNTVSFDQTKYLSKEYWLKDTKLGAFTELASTNQLSAFPTVYNANLAKTIEVGTTSVPTITTLSGLTSASALATVGTITAGAWQGNTLQNLYGGNGSTSLSQYRVLLGNATGSTTVATSTGTTGQVLTSSGEGVGPSWVSLPPTNEASNYSWTGQHRFSLPVNASSSLLVLNNLSVASSSPNTTRNLSVEGGAMIGGTTTVSKLVIASSTAQINGLNLTWPSSQSTTSVMVNDGNGVLSFQRIADAGASTTLQGFTGNLVFGHGLGRQPTLLKITAISEVDDGGTLELSTSWGIATSTGTVPNTQQSVIGTMVRAAATIDYANYITQGAIIDLQDGGAASSFRATVISWTTTTFTLNVSANNTGSNEDIRKILWEIY